MRNDLGAGTGFQRGHSVDTRMIAGACAYLTSPRPTLADYPANSALCRRLGYDPDHSRFAASGVGPVRELLHQLAAEVAADRPHDLPIRSRCVSVNTGCRYFVTK